MPLAKSFISLDVLEHFLKHERLILVNKDFPDDARIKQVVVDAERGGLWLVVESATLDEVAPAAMLPDLPITITLIEYQEDLGGITLPSRTQVMAPEEPLLPLGT